MHAHTRLDHCRWPAQTHYRYLLGVKVADAAAVITSYASTSLTGPQTGTDRRQ
jgi:hypothetical protein